MPTRVSNILSFYLPKRFRRWYVLVPAWLFAGVCLFVAVVLIAASFIRSDAFFQKGPLARDARMQLAHLAEVIRNADRTGQLDIYDGYSAFSGRHVEWNAIFYTFAGMALVEIHDAFPEYRNAAADLLTLCARGVTRIPPDVTNDRVASYLESHDYTGSPIAAAYVGAVLALRKKIVPDTLFDTALVPVAESLAAHLDSSCTHCTSEWTSDHATQLYAIWLYDQTFGKDHSALFHRWQDVMRRRFLEDRTHLLYSLVSVGPDDFLSAPLATSLAWTAVFLADVMPEFARKQYAAMCQYRQCRFFNLSATAEYSRRKVFEIGDVDSGPLFLGISPAATGFTLCAHKLYDAPSSFARAYRIIELLGSPRTSGDRKYYYRGNAMGDAILLYAKVAQAKRPG
jgi:hypothetical protein